MTRRERLYNYGKAAKQNALSSMQKLTIVAVIILMTVAVYLICFVGRQSMGPQLLPNQKVMVRVISAINFEYQSELRTKDAKERASKRVPPAYDIVKIPEVSLNENLMKLVELLNERQMPPPTAEESEEIKAEVSNVQTMTEEAFLDHVKRSTGFNINAADLPYILSETNLKNRQRIFWLVVTPLKDIINDGIYKDDDEIFANEGDPMYEVAGQPHFRRSQSQARMALKERINNLGIPDSLGDAFYRIFNQKLTPNMVYNEAESKKRIEKVISKIKPVVVKISEGDTILEPDKPDKYAQERLWAYRKEIEKDQDGGKFLKEFVREFTISFLLIFSAALFIKISRSSQSRKPKTIMLFSALMLANLIIQRIIIQISDSSTSSSWFYIFTYSVPIMIGPIILVLLSSPYMSFVMSLTLATLTVMMLGQNISFFVVVLSSCLVAIYFTNGAQTRKQVMMGGTLYGLALAIFSCILGFVYGYEGYYLLRMSGLAILSGFLTGIFATVILPLIERVFKVSSNITLLEFTDYNNPLLRMLQMEAPGTYHHSLMVSQIAEQAAVKIGANPLVCSVGGLFHDIGKVIKPEFFSENQAASNPHDTQLPSMSALIIKSHIREGLDLAKKYKMPPPVIEAISQHHGNSVISYFYNKARNLAGNSANKETLLQALRDMGIEESTYRHEGEKPQTTEAAILMLADSCEAASRSLKRVTAHSIEELVDKIFQSKMNDGQLDESPITLKQIAKVRESFIFTLQNMLHSRVEYNNAHNGIVKHQDMGEAKNKDKK